MWPMRLMTLNVASLLILCLVTMCAGCVSPAPKIVTETETVIIEKEVLVPVPAGLTEQVEVPVLPANPDTIQLGAAYRATVIRLMVANGKLAEIRDLYE